jgi:hypothetical protein
MVNILMQKRGLREQNQLRGFSLVEALIVIGLIVLVFGGLFASFEYSLKLIAQSRAKMTALSLANDRIEYIRSLPYTEVGTVAGIPNGAIPQNRSVSLNGVDFNERVLIEFYDDPGDGVGALDSNGVLADYKKVKVEYTWNVYGVPRSLSLISNIVPISIETDSGGGTVRVNVISASAVPLPGISVRLTNDTTTSTIDVTRTTDATGTALFTGAPAASDYFVEVFAPGYSSDGTIAATTTLPAPVSPPFSLAEASISTVNFTVDRLSDIFVRAYTAETIDTLSEIFDDPSRLIASSSVAVAPNSITLNQVAGVFETSGTVLYGPYSPSLLEAWRGIIVNRSLSPNTEVRVRFYTGPSTGTLIDESVLPGNAAGFTEEEINLVRLDEAAVSSLYVGLTLSTTDTSFTPTVDGFDFYYASSRTYANSETINFVGNRTIGQNATFNYVYKNVISTTTNSNGEINLNQIEWDNYTISASGLEVQSSCPSSPFNLVPGSSSRVDLLLASDTTHNLRVFVKDGFERPVYNALVDVNQGGNNYNATTDWCGQVYFESLAEAVNYTIDVTKSGFSTNNTSDVSVSGSTLQEVILMP